MARKRTWDEDIFLFLRRIEVTGHGGMDVVSACRQAGVSDKAFHGWRKRSRRNGLTPRQKSVVM